MKGITLWVSLSLVRFTFVVQVAIAFLSPPCSQIPFQPGCTNDERRNVKCDIPDLHFFPIFLQPRIPNVTRMSSRLRRMGHSCPRRPGKLARPDGIIPPWFNRPLALRGQQINYEYLFPWYAVMVFAILIKLNMPDIRNPLMFNKKHTNGPDNAKRDMATLMQGILWTKDHFYDMPIEGNSSYVNSIRNVAAIHANVEMRARAKQTLEGCIVSRNEYANQTTNDVLWDAFESDMKNSRIPQSQRAPSPTTWPTCPLETECKACKKCEPCKGPRCTRKCTNCSGCKASMGRNNAIPTCMDAQVKTYRCGTCICNGNKKNCGECENCTNTKKCLNFVPPLFNQQAMVLVLYPVVAYPILFPKDLAINACDGDLWAFNHFFSMVGYGLGIDDKCNVFLQPDLESARNYYRKMNRLSFQGLSTVTGGVLSPTFLLHRFVHNFLNQPAPRLQALMRPKELAFDRALDFAYMPQFMNNPTYRNLANRALNGIVSRASAAMFQGNCKDLKTTAQKCFV
ncbi:hypothetical protein Fcan01_25725 [Folsomia candida]|uniref:Uncharacterized protein n=1 Tax=Folsomia candida TaxID=158441 RepID=A0A226D1R6_FOLCA|nr:hypothetical protein Fcan01_25725 [Folsomia candida]